MNDYTHTTLPWLCPDHPKAAIRHSWDQRHYVLNGEAAGQGIYAGNDRWECAVCGRELEPEKRQ